MSMYIVFLYDWLLMVIVSLVQESHTHQSHSINCCRCCRLKYILKRQLHFPQFFISLHQPCHVPRLSPWMSVDNLETWSVSSKTWPALKCPSFPSFSSSSEAFLSLATPCLREVQAKEKKNKAPEETNWKKSDADLICIQGVFPPLKVLSTEKFI